jgi:hypothetical protein
MSDEILQHTKLDGITDYTAALDTLCGLAQHNLYLFEKNFEGMGFNSEARYLTLRHFLLGSPNHRLYVLTHDTHYLSTLCPRMLMLLTQFSNSMAIFKTPPHLQSVSEPFSVADDAHYLRRFHFDDPRGILAQNDPEGARTLKSHFMEMWSVSHQGVSASRTGL